MIVEDKWNLLKKILYSNYSNKYEIARDFVKTYDLNTNKLGDFILEEILSTLNSYVALKNNGRLFIIKRYCKISDKSNKLLR